MLKPLTTTVPCAGCAEIEMLVAAPPINGVTSSVTDELNPTFALNPDAVGGGWLPMAIVTARDPVPEALVAVTVTADVPGPAGTPEISPVVVFTAKPAGKPVALKLVGTLLAAI